jgi:hypothetical protein
MKCNQSSASMDCPTCPYVFSNQTDGGPCAFAKTVAYGRLVPAMPLIVPVHAPSYASTCPFIPSVYLLTHESSLSFVGPSVHSVMHVHPVLTSLAPSVLNLLLRPMLSDVLSGSMGASLKASTIHMTCRVLGNAVGAQWVC